MTRQVLIVGQETKRYYMVTVDKCPAEKINKIHAALKEISSAWWHRLDATWIIFTSELSKGVRDAVKSVIKDAEETAVLVLRLPDDPKKRGWAYYGPDTDVRLKWIKETYTKE